MGDDGGIIDYCKKYYSKVKDVKCTYDYYASAIIFVEITDKSGKHPVYDESTGKTEFKNIKLKFNILSGNGYEEINALTNPSFEDGVYQQTKEQLVPNGWSLINNKGTYAEAVTKSNIQLPEIERIGQPKALILDGDNCYKIFNKYYVFDISLKQDLKSIQPQEKIVVDVPVQAHLHYEDKEDYDYTVSQIIVSLNGIEKSFTGIDRTWIHAYNNITVPADGKVNLEVRVLTKYPDPEGKDFFLDNLKVYRIAGDVLEPKISQCNNEKIILPPETPLGTGLCYYCKNMKNSITSWDPTFVDCGNTCCSAKCPSGSKFIDVPYTNQCGPGEELGTHDGWESTCSNPCDACLASCGSTSMKIVLDYYGIHKTVDELRFAIGKSYYGDADYNKMTQTLSQYSGKNFVYIPSGGTWQNLIRELDKNYPVIVGTSESSCDVNQPNYKCYCTDGHILVAVGYSGDYIIMNDPYTGGQATGCRKEAGEKIVYPKNEFLSIWKGNYIKLS
jgi:hypothetical protein